MSDMTSNSSSSDRAPRVSVLLPVYNATAYLAEALDSVLAQTFTDFECICVDDGSTDGSLQLLNVYKQRDKRIRVIGRPNTGIVGALNDGLAAARGDYIARMDADDTCAPARFAAQVEFLDQHPDHVAVSTWVTRTDPFGSPAGTQEPPLDHDAIDAALMRADGSVLTHATLVIRRDALLAIQGWRDQYNWVEDLDLFLRLAEVGRLANIPQHLYSYRRHAGSVCFRNYELMCRRLKDVLLDAYERRGRTDAPDLHAIRPELRPHQSTAEHYRNWACHAIHRGHTDLARRHALTAMRHAPMSPRTWKVMYWAMCSPNQKRAA